MPIYVMACACGHTEEIFRTVAGMNDDLPQHCGATMQRRIMPAMVANDIEPYRSMCDGTMITSRSQHRAHLRQHGVQEVGNEKIAPRKSTLGIAGDIKQDLADVLNSKM